LDEISPKNSTGYKLAAAKSPEEYAKLDAEDESLNRWKASLGLAAGAPVVASGPKVVVDAD
jgi:Rho GDP-dissociation inhibitor